MAQVLYNRGITTQAQFKALVSADEAQLFDPFLLPGINNAVPRLLTALERGEKIALFGDFDADGVTATSLLFQALTALGGHLITYIPHRIGEGHGLNMPALEGLQRQGASLVLTADCGISSYQEVEEGNRRGLEFVLVDHHTPPAEVPPALASINPRLSPSSYPYPHLASVGVAFKLAQALFTTLGRSWDRDWLELVAIGTVADVAPLTGENHALVKQGLTLLQNTRSLGLRALLDSASIEPAAIDAESISYILAPRLNAAGRLDDANTSFRLLTTTSPEEARLLASELEEWNAQRKKMTKEVLESAHAQAQSDLSADHAIIMVGDPTYPVGILGLAAGKLAEEWHRPAIVMRPEEEYTRASARSIPEFNLIAALVECGDLFERYGGHPQAAGFTIANQRVDALRERLRLLAREKLTGLDPQHSLTIDAEISLDRLTGPVLKDLVSLLSPYGHENDPPTFLSRGLVVQNARPVGGQGDHLRLKVKAGTVTWDAIAFEQGPLAATVTPRLDMVYRFIIDRWRGNSSLKLDVLDFRASA